MTTTPGATRLILIRHGETVWNVEKRAQGHLDSPLTRTGLAQARAIGRRMRHVAFDMLYSSDLGRAYQTAAHIAEKSGQRIIPEAALRERNLGVRQGLTGEEFARQFPEIHAAYASGDPDYAVPGGESVREFYRRGVACCESLVLKHPGRTVVAVTHGGFLSEIFRHVLDIPLTAPRKFEIPNAGFNEFTYAAGSWRLAAWGDVCHLRNEALDEIDAG